MFSGRDELAGSSGTLPSYDSTAAVSSSGINYGLCSVCTDKANGVHYGVATCEGCKGFYKRSLHKHQSYACYLGKQCVMTLRGRKNCKFCRWQACLNAGMIYDG
jgi:hypothetical protein